MVAALPLEAEFSGWKYEIHSGQQANKRVRDPIKGFTSSQQDQNRRVQVTGACECVGLVGPLLGGGHGYLQGFYGLLSDNLISARLVLANGEAISVSAAETPGKSEKQLPLQQFRFDFNLPT